MSGTAGTEVRTPARPAGTGLALKGFDLLARRGDLALAALVVAVIALLVLPLPNFLLDTLIAINLAASITLLMLALYIPSSLGLSTFPSLLLLTTLFRLSLNIASTKLILLHAQAGHVIETFGRLVVGGNVVVGLVVFLIIAIVQFIVIAKGAERVAEVGARFSLDGMPGKQMSIDADLRAGIIDKDEAQRRRREIEEESQLHGAMDGAMKFVKGDAIAGIIIAFVNIVAGIAIGATMHGMALGAAVSTYSVLSIGDGMVAQIPSLFVSIAAGIVITRVDGNAQASSNLGALITQQVLAHPTALLMAGAIVSMFLLVPGLPFWQFLGVASLLLILGYAASVKRRRPASYAGSEVETLQRIGAESGGGRIEEAASGMASPLRLRLASGLRTHLNPEVFDRAIDRAKAALLQDLGLPFPALGIRFEDGLVNGGFAIDVQELQVAEGVLVPRADGFARAPRLDAAEGDLEGQLATRVEQVVRRHAAAFVGMQEMHVLLTRAADAMPDLVAELQRSVPLQRTTEVLRRLVQEGVSIRYLREIAESLITWNAREKDIVLLTEYVRVDLGRFITRRFVRDDGSLHAMVLDGEVEQLVRDCVQQGAGGSFLALSPDASKALTDGADVAFADAQAGGPALLVVPMDVRRYLKKFLGTRFPALDVLSFQELPPETEVQITGRLAMQFEPRLRSA